MKKYFLTIMLITVLFITGCGKINEEKIKNNFIKEVENLDSYYLEGVMNLTNNDDVYQYNVEVSYKSPDYYKVVLTNNSNDYTQILIKNDEGVYVLTPALNKSFKFQSNWPNNSSQSYLLNSVANDLKNDDSYTFEEKDDNYVYTVKADYPNNKELQKQKITIDKDGNLKKVEVINNKNIPLIEFTITSMDKKAVFKSNYFNIDEENIQKEQEDDKLQKEKNAEANNNCDNEECEEETTENEEITKNENNNTQTTLSETSFPLYLPDNTTLSNKEVVKIENGERVIMTFAGDYPFILVEETAKKEDELTIIPTYGEPYLLVDTVGSLTDMSYTWTSNGIEYYIVSDVMDTNELLEVARSLNVVSTISTK